MPNKLPQNLAAEKYNKHYLELFLWVGQEFGGSLAGHSHLGLFGDCGQDGGSSEATVIWSLDWTGGSTF